MPQNKKATAKHLIDLQEIERVLVGEAATQQLGEDLAMVAQPGWTFLLDGDLGAGKSTLARAFIRALADDPALDVPSPTYTLVQRYEEAKPTVLHADLYRLSDPDEMVELGLNDPDDPCIQLIEWPQNGGENAFYNAVTVSFSMQGSDARLIKLIGPQEHLQAISKSLDLRQFLDGSGHENVARRRLAGDASTRRYERIAGDQPLILMDAPKLVDTSPLVDGKSYNSLVHRADSVDAFVAVGNALRERGFAAPKLYADNLEKGILLLEDLGQEGILKEDGSPHPQRYQAAVTTLAALHKHSWPDQLDVAGGGTHRLHRYDRSVFKTEISLCPDWYTRNRPDSPDLNPETFERSGFLLAWESVLRPLDEQPSTLTLRDYHSPNIIWQETAEGISKIGIIDHQDALLGPPAYDVASLVQDARVTVPRDLQLALLDAYCQAAVQTGLPQFDRDVFIANFHVMAAQRNTKILGIFSRLNIQDGKSAYLKHMPRIETYMHQLLEHPVLADLKPYYDALLPERTV